MESFLSMRGPSFLSFPSLILPLYHFSPKMFTDYFAYHFVKKGYIRDANVVIEKIASRPTAVMPQRSLPSVALTITGALGAIQRMKMMMVSWVNYPASYFSRHFRRNASLNRYYIAKE